MTDPLVPVLNVNIEESLEKEQHIWNTDMTLVSNNFDGDWG